ncbi:Subtilisin DY [Anatilimnocola aggregata]|uniref:Subtilisin DY n=1 Tax=Anatilimnocola aggregata TaxID=2528021 RepID=A0A517YHH0_9BACT|nr:S8 family serine peptidase [Anatilimnocola aggregata]QDU29664.1 Subtilisin DY [Anatilimnocola aggregata]
MAKKKAVRPARVSQAPPVSLPPPADTSLGNSDVQTTGRYIVIFKDGGDSAASIRNTLSNKAGLSAMASSADFEDGATAAQSLDNAATIHFEHLGMAVVSGLDAATRLSASTTDTNSPILRVEPEYIAYAMNPMPGGLSLDYIRGYRSGVNQLCDQLLAGDEEFFGSDLSASLAAASFADTAQFTWGLQATKVDTTPHDGQGIKIAILDTGLNMAHPDFAGRAIVSRSFMAGISVHDVNGHGTHCAGTACGARTPASGVRRYGVAHAAHLHVGKVFNNAARPQAPTGVVIAGIEWAVSKGCRVASLSLGFPLNQKVDQFEVAIKRAATAGTLVVCAAGNNAQRPGNVGFVEPPANARNSVAVGAVDSNLRIAPFSARSSTVVGIGGIVNIAAPGVAVFSSYRSGHEKLPGTSMAAPHVAGIAALWSQATGDTGAALWNRLVQNALPLSAASADVGAGLIQAPQQ